MGRSKARPKGNLFWRITISLVGIILILMAISSLLLFIFGETAQADVTTRRTGGERTSAVNDKRYTWSVDYTFRAENGEVYEGHLQKLGSATAVTVDRTIRYFTFAPFFNTTEETARPNLGQLVMLAFGVFLIIAMNKKPARMQRRTAAQTLTDYDDSIEDYFHQEATMSKFCTKCGSALAPDARFCPSCGQAAAGGSSQQTAPAGQTAQPSLVGWTTHHLDPSVQNRAEKNKKSAWIFTLVLTILFPVGFAVAGLAVEDMPFGEALIIGIGLGLMMLVIGLVRIARMKNGTWDGTVTDKKQKQKVDRNQDDYVSYRTIYTLVITEDNGKQHRLNYTDNAAVYNYFNIGDRVRCHMAFGTYEKYDKSRDSIIYCNICGKQNDVFNSQCISCRLPLFK